MQSLKLIAYYAVNAEQFSTTALIKMCSFIHCGVIEQHQWVCGEHYRGIVAANACIHVRCAQTVAHTHTP